MTGRATERRKLPVSRMCYICGKDNPQGFRKQLFYEEGVVTLPFELGEHYCGIEGIVHGGILAAHLDECMSWAAVTATRRACVTGDLSVRYVKPVPRGRSMKVEAWAAKANCMLAHVEGRIVDEGASVYVRAKARFAALSREDTLALDDGLIYLGDEARFFDGLRERMCRERWAAER